MKSGTAIVKQSQEQSLTPEKQRTALVAGYLYRFAEIAGRDLGSDSDLIKIFVEALKDLDMVELKRGLDRWLRDGDRFPWPSQIRELSEL